MHELMLLVQRGEVPIKCNFVQKYYIYTTAYSKNEHYSFIYVA